MYTSPTNSKSPSSSLSPSIRKGQTSYMRQRTNNIDDFIDQQRKLHGRKCHFIKRRVKKSELSLTVLATVV